MQINLNNYNCHAYSSWLCSTVKIEEHFLKEKYSFESIAFPSKSIELTVVEIPIGYIYIGIKSTAAASAQ